MSENKLKLFVWEGEGVLTDYTDGMICVLANNLEEALKLIEKKCNHCMNSFPPTKYKIISKPEAFVCYGGG